MDMGEIKQTNFRIDADTADAFRLFCSEHGMNQAQGFDHIMQVVELDRAKSETQGRTTEIEAFEKAVKDIMAAYLNSVELGNRAEERAKEQFQTDLKRKNQIIDGLQETIKRLTNEKNELQSAAEAAEAEKTAAEERIHASSQQAEAAKKTAADQEQINVLLKAQLEEALKQSEHYDALKQAETKLKEELADAKHQLKENESTLSHFKELCESHLTELQTTTDKCKALEDEETNAKAQIAALERQLSEQKTDYEHRLKQFQMQADLEKERAVIAKEREMQAELRKIDKENARLSAEIEQLQPVYKQADEHSNL